MGSTVSFEVMVFKEGHWTIAFITDNKDEAISEAKTAESGKHSQAVKVVQETTDDETGNERSRTIYSGGIQDGIPDHKGAKKLYERKAGLKNRDHEEPEAKGQTAKAAEKLHPERVTNLIDRVRLSVIVFGSVCLLLVVLVFSYISNPDAVAAFMDGFFK